MRRYLTNYLKATGAFLGSALDPDGVHYRVIVGPAERVQWMYARLHSNDVGQWTEARIFLAEHPLFPAARRRSLGAAIACAEQKLGLLYEFNTRHVAAQLREGGHCFPMDLWGDVLGDLITAFRLHEADFYADARNGANAELFPALHQLMQFEKQHPEIVQAAAYIDQTWANNELEPATPRPRDNVIPFPAKAR
jgi:hypothetical protein